MTRTEKFDACMAKIEKSMEARYPEWLERQRQLYPRTLDWKGSEVFQKANYGYAVYQTLEGQWMMIDPMMIDKRTTGFYKVDSLEHGKKLSEKSFKRSFDFLTRGVWKEA